LASHDGLTDHFDTSLAGSRFVGRQVDAWMTYRTQMDAP